MKKNNQQPPQLIDLPEVFWSVYGISNPFSGVANVAFQINRSLRQYGIKPKMLGPRPEFGFAENSDLRLTSIERKLLGVKLFSADTGFFRTWLRREKTPAVVHGFSNFNVPIILPKSDNFRFFVTVHDLIPLIAPEKVSKALEVQLKLILPRALERSDKIIAVSHWTARSLERLYPQHSAKIVVIQNGTDGIECPSPEQLPQDRPIDVLFVSRFESYKRFDLLASIIERSARDRNFVVITDERGKIYLSQRCPTQLTQRSLTIATSVPQAQLVETYKKSKMLLITSEYEGYCLPFVEATSQGCHAVWRRGTAIDEFSTPLLGFSIGSEDNLDQWMAAIEACIGSWTSEKSRALIEGLNARPTWDAAAKKLISLYNS